MLKKNKLKLPKVGEVCSYCNGDILVGDRWVLLGTYIKKKKEHEPVAEISFHIKCWRKYFQDRVKQILQSKTQQAMGMLSKLTGGFMNKDIGEMSGI